MSEVRIEEIHEDTERQLFEALRLELPYHKDTNQIECTVTLAGTTPPATRHATH
ncbi:hypothetical protein SAMN05421854_109165 [Amycolatopsis rubida]|uniref:Uncharacterized protein n=1 Tax=Amycolatopsis rubida TaxID=112413 RepID=A0A1I5WCR4_9PSEU|nr:hypothetical protein SAMN05421854_109165 [Amycolatopsis rubida]